MSRFVFRGFSSNSSLPVGIQKSTLKGLGFTKVLAPIMEVLASKPSLRTIEVVKTGQVGFTPTTLTLTEAALQKLHPVFQNIIERHKDERLTLARTKLNELFPNDIKVGKKKYIANSVNSALSTWSQDIDDFSSGDKEAIKDLFDMLSLTEGFLTAEMLLKTKSILDKQYIEDVIDSYTALMKQKHETPALEKKWQRFFSRHNWVFS